jgi:hypothetical protein
MPSLLIDAALAAAMSLGGADQGIYQPDMAGGARLPGVTMEFPPGKQHAKPLLAGRWQVRWQVAGADGSGHDAMLYYSADRGRHWRLIGEAGGIAAQGAMTVDFDSLPGSGVGRALLRVVVSDGERAGSATSAPFTVARKRPQDAMIVSPAPGSVVPLRSQVRLEGSAFDADDGVLLGKAISWRSDRDGPLGSGVMLRTSSLSVGRHVLTMRASDRDGNTASAEVVLVVVAH